MSPSGTDWLCLELATGEDGGGPRPQQLDFLVKISGQLHSNKHFKYATKIIFYDQRKIIGGICNLYANTKRK